MFQEWAVQQASRTVREVYFGDLGYCDWAVGQEPKVWTLTRFKYVLERVGDMLVRGWRRREEGGGNW